ncbi:MAG TPA: formate dehydrogenase accessory sulfurtransferase FdhD [Methanospirillum sp.]|nr:formate dehydrogenase accessory sulfurtransferase FdhD [Methanospirillum sp.]
MPSTDLSSYQITKPVQVTRFDGNQTVITQEEVCTEETATIRVNGVPIVSLAITPEHLEAFARGHLVCEGWIQSHSEIVDIKTTGMLVEVTIPSMNPREKEVEIEVRSSGCPGRRGTWSEIDHQTPDGFSVTSDLIFTAGKTVNELATIWQKTGGTHCSVIMDRDGTIIAVAEDMGRHSSVDKAVGHALQKGVDLSQTILACSGRLPADMVAKGVRAGIPIIISHNAPFIHGIELARKANVTLAGFVRPPRMNIYSAPHRIIIQREDPDT